MSRRANGREDITGRPAVGIVMNDDHGVAPPVVAEAIWARPVGQSITKLVRPRFGGSHTQCGQATRSPRRGTALSVTTTDFHTLSPHGR